VYGVGFTRQGHVLYYNKDILSKAGVDPENPPRTFADMATVCQKVKAIGKDCWAVGGKDLGLPLVMGAEAVKVATQSQMLDLAAGKAKWTDPEFVQLLEIMAKIGREGWYQKGYQADGFGTQEPGVFESGRTAFALGLMGDGLNWSDFGTIMGFDKIGVVGLPDVGDGVPAGVQAGPLNGTIGVALNIGLSVPTWSAHPKEAELLIRYAVDPTVQRAMVEVTKGPFPALKTAEASWNSQPAFGQLLDMAANSKAAGLLAYIGFGYLLPLNAQLQSLSAGKTTPQAAAEAIQKAAEAVRSS
jgi:multiple sugar transport system substrate-binding protein